MRTTTSNTLKRLAKKPSEGATAYWIISRLIGVFIVAIIALFVVWYLFLQQ